MICDMGEGGERRRGEKYRDITLANWRDEDDLD